MVEDEDISSMPLDIEIRVTGENEISFSCGCPGTEDGTPVPIWLLCYMPTRTGMEKPTNC